MVKEIPITKNQVVLVDDEDFERLNNHGWCAIRMRCKSEKYYAAATIKTKLIKMHHFILNVKKGTIVDHINGNSLDNRKSNLRVVTARQNAQNRHDKRTSKYPGVSWKTSINKWVAQIKIDGKKKHLGYFKNEKEAFKAYKKSVHELIGEKLVCELEGGF